MRAIDGDALIEKAYDEAKGMAEPYDDFGTLVEWLVDKAPTIEPEPKWIPCSEWLPENKTAYYLATIANYGKFFSSTLPDDVGTVRWDYDRRKGNDSWHWCTERTVIAWMPLPEPYKEKQDG